MIATQDIGALAAKTLQESWTGNRFLEPEGPERYSMQDAAAAFSALLGKSVYAKGVPCDGWSALFEQQGMPADRTSGRIEMLDGFNSGRIDFEGDGKTEHVQGGTAMEIVFGDLVSTAR